MWSLFLWCFWICHLLRRGPFINLLWTSQITLEALHERLCVLMMPSYVRHLLVLFPTLSSALGFQVHIAMITSTMIWFAPELGSMYEQLYTTKGGQIL